jgi:hypothetical protein
VHGSDGREHVDYDLVISNLFTVPVRLASMRVFSGGATVLALSGRALADNTLALASPTATIPVSSFVGDTPTGISGDRRGLASSVAVAGSPMNASPAAPATRELPR